MIERPAPEPVEVWPDNADALAVFSRLMTQWTVSHNGPVGISYPSIPIVCQVLGTAHNADLHDALMAMESEALRVFAEKRK